MALVEEAFSWKKLDWNTDLIICVRPFNHLSFIVFWTYFAHEGAAWFRPESSRLLNHRRFRDWSEKRASDWSVNSTTIISHAAVHDGFSVYLSGAVFQGNN